MKCGNCGAEIAEGLSFCTNCGTALPAGEETVPTDRSVFSDGQMDSGDVEDLGASLAAAVEQNQDVIGSIEAHGEIAEQAAARWAEAEAAPAVAGQAPAVDPVAAQAYVPPSYDAPQPPTAYQSGYADQAAGVAAAAGAAASVPFYQQDVSPNAHYSSQRSYAENAYGQNVGQPGQYGQPGAGYQQPSYNAGSAPAQEQVWAPQTATHRAFAMTLYVAGLLGLIFGLVVRDKDDAFITHHLNNVAVIVIGMFASALLSVIIIGSLLALYLLVMLIMGIISAYNGDMKELPLIGKIHIVK